MEPDSSLFTALGRLEGKVETLLPLHTANSERTATLETRANGAEQRLATVEAQVGARTDTGRFWITTLSSLLAVVIAGLALAKDFIK